MLCRRMLDIRDTVVDDARGEQSAAESKMAIKLSKEANDDVCNDVRRNQLCRRSSLARREQIALARDNIMDIVLANISSATETATGS